MARTYQCSRCFQTVIVGTSHNNEECTNALKRPALDTLFKDPHSWSTRLCATCNAMTEWLGEPFGCNRYRLQHKNK